MKKTIYSVLIFFLLGSSLQAQIPDKNKKESKKAYNSAVQLIRSGDYARAISYLDKSFELNKEFTEAIILKAKAKVELGDIQGALEDFRGITFMEPSLGEPWFYLGYLQFTGDTLTGVIENFNKAVSLGFTDYQVYYFRGLYKLLIENYTGAITDLTEAIRQNESLAEAYHDRATAKRQLGDMQGALYDYRLATNHKHAFPVAFNNMASVKVVLGDYEGALEDYSVAINLDPDFHIALNNRGCIHYYMGNLEEAEADFDRALSLNPDYLKSMNNKANVLARYNEHATAVSVYNEILEDEYDFAAAYLNRGLVKELMGNLEGACEDWNMAYELGIEQAGKYIEECN